MQTSTSFEDLRNAASTYASRGDYAGAVNTYTAALARNPQDIACLLARSLANMNLETPNMDAAIRDADAAIDAQPGSWQAWNQKGNALMASEKYGEAEQAFQHAARLAQPTEKLGPEQMLTHVRRLRATSAPVSK